MDSNRRPTIVHLYANPLNGKGGIERQAEYLIRALKDLPDAPHVVYRRTRYSEWGVLHPLSTLIALFQFIGFTLITRPRLVHIHIARKGSTVRKLAFLATARMLQRPIILHLHGSSYDVFYSRLPGPAQSVIRWGFSLASKVVVLGDHWRRFVVETLCASPGRVQIIDNGAPSAPLAQGPGTDRPRMAFVGAVGDRKGVDILLDACAKLKDIPWDLDIVGGGDLDRFKTQAAALNLTDRVTFAGWRNENAVGEILNRASLFVLPSRAENQPVSILEAMARGLPVVATDVGAIPEVVKDGQTGHVVPPEDAGALSVALQGLLTAPTQRQAMGQAGRALFEDQYSIGRTANAFHTLYQSLHRDGTISSQDAEEQNTP